MMPRFRSSLPGLRKARALRPGGTIGIVAPAAAVDREALESGAELLRGAGFEVTYRDDLFARHRYLAGDDARRAKELMEFVDDPRVGAIVCARGGYGCHRIIDRLDAERVRAARKPLLGYSDVTTLLLWQRCRAGRDGRLGHKPTRRARGRHRLCQALGVICGWRGGGFSRKKFGQDPRTSLLGRHRCRCGGAA